MFSFTKQSGQSLIEIIFAIAIFTIGIVTIGFLAIDARVSIAEATNMVQARMLAEEGIEAVISIRDKDFDLLTSGTYGLLLVGGYWTLSSAVDNQFGFERTIDIVNIDDDTKDVTSQVRWNSVNGKEKKVLYTIRLTNWRKDRTEEYLIEEVI